jgi:D-alanyl-D-alanine dipeptidase
MSQTLALVAAALTTACSRSTIVDIHSVNPHVLLDIRYATTNNFTGQKVYDSANCLLRASTARKLSDAQLEAWA